MNDKPYNIKRLHHPDTCNELIDQEVRTFLPWAIKEAKGFDADLSKIKFKNPHDYLIIGYEHWLYYDDKFIGTVYAVITGPDKIYVAVTFDTSKEAPCRYRAVNDI